VTIKQNNISPNGNGNVASYWYAGPRTKKHTMCFVCAFTVSYSPALSYPKLDSVNYSKCHTIFNISLELGKIVFAYAYFTNVTTVIEQRAEENLCKNIHLAKPIGLVWHGFAKIQISNPCGRGWDQSLLFANFDKSFKTVFFEYE
jgi:hypothetical protein